MYQKITRVTFLCEIKATTKMAELKSEIIKASPNFY